MLKFLYFVSLLPGILLFGYFTLGMGIVIFYRHNYTIESLLGFFLFGLIFLVGIWQMVEVFKQTDNTETEKLKTDNTENDEIITVTEIKGVKKIIKNGKVIYCEQLKADELKVFEQLK